MDLAELLRRCQAGDELAWESFVRRFQGRIYAIAYSYAGNPDDARDLAQDIFVRLYATRRKWAPADMFVPWLVRPSRNLAVDFLRRRGARTAATEVGLDDAHDLAGQTEDPEEHAHASQRRSLIWEAMRKLTQISRETIILRDIHGLSLEEVAATLRIPLGTVKSRTSRARVELAQHVLAISQPESAQPGRRP